MLFIARAAAATAALCWSVCVGGTYAKIFQGELPAESNFAAFVGKFCFDYKFTGNQSQTVGLVNASISWLPKDGHPSLHQGKGKLWFMVYDDEPEHWKAASREMHSANCAERVNLASRATPLVGKDEAAVTIRIKEGIRPRFWYAVIAGCNVPAAPREYTVHFVNALWTWQQEFSLDHMGLLKLYVIGAIAFLLATVLTNFAASQRAALMGIPVTQHPHIQLVKLSLVASTVSCICFSLHYMRFQRDGFGSQRIRFLAVLAGEVANCTIFLVAMLSSVGWGVSKAALTHRRTFIGAVTFVGCLSAYCEIHAETAADSSTKLYGFQSTVGVLAMILKIFIFCWFASQIQVSHAEELHEKQRRFYKWLGCGFSIWVLNVPVTVIMAFKLPPWERYRAVMTVDLITRFAGQALLAHLFCGPLTPISSQNTFPALDHIDMDNFGRLNDGS